MFGKLKDIHNSNSNALYSTGTNCKYFFLIGLVKFVAILLYVATIDK